ncbi:MAG: hypothetical protein KDB03_03555 [Planctomycetales bacterium]|nr:hypothetical protein [Planctomycetales bacterium]
MFEKLQELQAQGIAIDSSMVSQQYVERTSDGNIDGWSELLASIEASEFLDSTKGIPRFDPTIEIDESGDTFDTSENWLFAEATTRLTTEFHHLVELSRHLAGDTNPTYFPILFQANETLLPEVQSTRTIARLLQADCQLAMYEKDAERAADDIVAMFELSKHVDAVPFVVSRLVGIAMRRMSLEALQHAIEIDSLRDEQLLNIDQAIASHCDIGDRWRRMILDEMSVHLPIFVTPHLYMDTDMTMPPRGHDALYFIDVMLSVAEIRTSDWVRFYDTITALESKFEQEMDSTLGMVDHILAGLLMPSFSAVAVAIVNDVQLHRQARMAIAVRIYQHQRGEFPDSLNSLPESTRTLVPFGDKPFGYSIENSRATIWGFQLSREVRRTPTSPPGIDMTKPESLGNGKVVWEMK